MRVVLAIGSTALVGLLVAGAGSTQTEPVRLHGTYGHAKQARDQESKRALAARLNWIAGKVATFRQSTWECQDTLGVKRTKAEVWVWDLPQSVPYRHWVLKRWKASTRSCQKVLDRRTLPTSNDWITSVGIVQRVFPGTRSWLLSCSAAEGGHGAWVRYGGGSYYPGYEYTGAVGAWLQYRWGTFKGHYRHGLEALRQKGFIVDLPEPDDVRAWLSPLAVAVAGGWARWSGNDDSHWSASWGNGC